MCPRTKEQFEALRAKRIGQIIEAAERLFLRKGLHFDIRDVAQEAGLGYGTVYHYYNNKQQLMHDVLDKGLQAAEAFTASQFSGGNMPASERLRLYCLGLPELWSGIPAAYMLYKAALERFAGYEPALAGEAGARFEAQLRAPVAECLRATGLAKEPAKKAADAMLGSLVGIYGLYAGRRGQGYDAAYVADMLMSGLGLSQEDKPSMTSASFVIGRHLRY
ncbi:TetR/AcrR family transcriptional regulator [Paenibacillus ginsengihumi]|uniref:TetR/AcrR family transcriptional regulator n=1 Tax=Paenibacillus ginsengihumi TaxID=431596 RepID=UPI000362EA0F|nr:TetR/AcrR family transcriptional regulator [Paenibacillus ginsengihumi]